MALEGELRGLTGVVCSCGKKLELQICYSPAGYYLGYLCNQCGPYSRETNYYQTWAEAEEDLGKAVPSNVRTTKFNSRQESC